jgi:hypothetical protein
LAASGISSARVHNEKDTEMDEGVARVKVRAAWAGAARSLALLCVGLGLAGCARRIDLTPAEFERVRAIDPQLENLRVSPHPRLLQFYTPEVDNVSREVTKRKVIERGEKKILRREIGRRTMGKILAIDELNGMPRLWVSFYTDCLDVACAYGFVQTEHQRYSLVAVPMLEGYKEPRSFRRSRLKRNRLGLMRLRSNVEINDVMAARRRSGKGKPIDLQIRKDRWRPTKTKTDKAEGFK